MANLSDIVIGLRADAGPLSRGLSQAQTALSSSARRMQATVGALRGEFTGLGGSISTLHGIIAGLAAGVLVQAIRRTLDWADNLDTLSQRLGVGVETLQRWHFVGQQFNVETEAMDKAIARFVRSMGDATEGLRTAEDAFARLQLDPRALKLESTDAAFQKVIERLREIPNRADQAKIANDIFGRSWQALVPLIRATSDEIQRQIDLAAQLGVVVEGRTVKSLAQLNDRFEAVSTAMRAKFAQAIVDLAPHLNWLVDRLTDVGVFLDTIFNLPTRGRLENDLKNTEAAIAVVTKRLEELQAQGSHGGVASSIAVALGQPSEFEQALRRFEQLQRRAAELRDQIAALDRAEAPPPLPTGAAPSAEGGRDAEAAAKEAERLRERLDKAFADITADRLRATGELVALELEQQKQKLAELARLEEEAQAQGIDRAQEFAEARLNIEAETAASIRKIQQDALEEQRKKDEEAAAERARLLEESIDGFVDLFQQVVIHGASTKDVLKALLAEILQEILKTQAAMSALRSVGSGIGGILGGIGGLFGIGRQSGGAVLPGRVYQVNERRRPELFVPAVAGRIIPDADRPGLFGGGASEVSLNVNVITMPGEPVRVSQSQAADGTRQLEIAVGRVIARDRARSGPITRVLGGGIGGLRG